MTTGLTLDMTLAMGKLHVMMELNLHLVIHVTKGAVQVMVGASEDRAQQILSDLAERKITGT
jgi:hypothetical protein